MSRFAISDIHGCCKTFRFMVEEKLNLQPTDTLYLLGDYIDRGPDSKGVIDFIMELQERGFNLITLCGNHEEMLLHARDNSAYLNNWLMNGGRSTLASFQATSIFGIPLEYWNFMEQLHNYVELEDYLLVHAGFNFEDPAPFDDIHSMLWIRDFEVNKDWTGNRKIVHGHTPTYLPEIKASLKEPNPEVINIDGGCVFSSKLGYLTALNLDTLELHAVQNIEEE